METLFRVKFFIFALYFIGCAPSPLIEHFASPKKIHFDPQPNITELNIGDGKRVSLIVNDSRREKNFGYTVPARPPLTRPPIISDQNILEVLKNKISVELKKKGFDILNDVKPGKIDLTVEVLHLKLFPRNNYHQMFGAYSNKDSELSVVFTFLIKCKNSSKPYGNTFHKETSGKIGLLQNTSISDLFNIVISEGLERMLQDVELLQCLKTI